MGLFDILMILRRRDGKMLKNPRPTSGGTYQSYETMEVGSSDLKRDEREACLTSRAQNRRQG